VSVLPVPDPAPPTPLDGDEKALLCAQLDEKRAILLRKVGGLDESQLRSTPTASSISLLGLLKHSAYVERYWFRHVFAGERPGFPWTDDDPDADWRPEAGETPQEIRDLYLDEVARSRAITDAAALDDEASTGFEDHPASLRGILLHMIQETSRHLGHADVIRETIDGATGD
jgi:uncharacterized damage-inducible protein DinB